MRLDAQGLALILVYIGVGEGRHDDHCWPRGAIRGEKLAHLGVVSDFSSSWEDGHSSDYLSLPCPFFAKKQNGRRTATGSKLCPMDHARWMLTMLILAHLRSAGPEETDGQSDETLLNGFLINTMVNQSMELQWILNILVKTMVNQWNLNGFFLLE